MKLKRTISALLLLAMLLSCLPFSALAAEAESEGGNAPSPEITVTADADSTTEPVTLTDDSDSFFYLAATAADRVIIAPERVNYAAGQTIAQALLASGHTFDGLEDGNVYRIDGVAGEFQRSDEAGEYSLTKQASEISFFCFTEGETAKPSEARQTLISTVADYLCEEADVRAYAKDAYDAALRQFVGISDEKASSCAVQITAKIGEYKTSLGSTTSVTFSGMGAGCTITAVSEYGKTYDDTGHSGTLNLPNGSYDFTVQKGALRVSGTISVPETKTVTVTMPEGGWLDTSKFEVSNSYNEFFKIGCYAIVRDGNTFTVTVPDTFSGTLYLYLPESGVTAKAIYMDTTQTEQKAAVTLGSYNSPISKVLAKNCVGNTVTIRLSKNDDANGFTQSEDYTLQLDRMPTLSSLAVTAGGAAQAAKETFVPEKTFAYTYPVLSTAASVQIKPTAFAAGSEITVDGKALTDGSADVALPGDTTTVSVVVENGEYSTTYTLTFKKASGKETIFRMNSGITLEIYNKNGNLIGEWNKEFVECELVPDTGYYYIATKDTYYHERRDFSVGETVLIDVATKPALTSLAFGSSNLNQYYGDYGVYTDFTAHTYTITVPDEYASPAIWAGAGAEETVSVIYSRITDSANSGTTRTVSVTTSDRQNNGTTLSYLLLSGNPYGNEATLRVSKESGNKTYYTDYLLRFKRTLSLDGLTLRRDGDPLTLNRLNADGVETGTTGFTPGTECYSVTVPAAQPSISLAAVLRNKMLRYGDTDNGYTLRIAVDGKDVAEGTEAEIPLNGTEASQTISLTLSHPNAPADRVYTITVKKAASTKIRVTLNPENAILFLEEAVSGSRVWPDENGAYPFSTGFTYNYLLTAPGYLGKSGTMTLEEQNGTLQLVLDGTAQGTGNVSLTLDKAAEGKPLTELEAEWPDFRGNSSNNAVTTKKTPVSAEDGMLYWAKKIGSFSTGTDGNASGGSAVSSPILVNGALIVYAGSRLYRINKDTGETLQTGTMAGESSFSINSATYADGMLFVALSNGRVQAFNAETLDSLWIYTDPLGGQSNCPVTVCDGYVYTGFWKGETGDANYVCLSVTDEDPDEPLEAKTATWRYTKAGGFYWAGAYVSEDFMLLGTDDGEQGYTNGHGSILLLDPKTGRVLDRTDAPRGDVRSSICYDSESSAYYATSKGGDFIRIKLAEDHRSIAQVDMLALANGVGGTAMSTSTPVVYKGRAYVGVSGSSQFKMYTGHNITVIDLSGAMSIAYRVETKGYPQTSGLLTTAYEKNGNDYVYVYFFDNYTPGTMRMLRDAKGQTTPSLITVEEEKDTAYAIFTPNGAQAQYAICSPIVDENGTIYFKNDSCFLMAYGSTIKELKASTSIKTYEAGKAFSMEGVTVTATLANGEKRDVTAMMSAPTKALEVGQNEVTLTFGKDQTMYHNVNVENSNTMKTEEIAPIKVELTIRVEDPTKPISGTQLCYQYDAASGKLIVTGMFESGQTLIAACYDANGRMIQVQTLTATGEMLLSRSKDSAKIKLFLLDKDSKPVCPAVTVKDSTT